MDLGFNNLTPFIPLSFKGEGERVLKGQSPFKLSRCGGIKRGMRGGII